MCDRGQTGNWDCVYMKNEFLVQWLSIKVMFLSISIFKCVLYWTGDCSRGRNESLTCSEGGSKRVVRVSVSTSAALYADTDWDRLGKELYYCFSSSYRSHLWFHEKVTSYFRNILINMFKYLCTDIIAMPSLKIRIALTIG